MRLETGEKENLKLPLGRRFSRMLLFIDCATPSVHIHLLREGHCAWHNADTANMNPS